MNTAGALSGPVAAVTGGDPGIGAACALTLAEAGADMALLVHQDGDAAAKVEGGIVSHGRRATRVAVGVGDGEIAVRDGHWTMGDEYARGEASMIGYAEGDGPTGPWRETKHSLGARRPVRCLPLVTRTDAARRPRPPDHALQWRDARRHLGDQLGRIRPSEQPRPGSLRGAA